METILHRTHEYNTNQLKNTRITILINFRSIILCQLIVHLYENDMSTQIDFVRNKLLSHIEKRAERGFHVS